MAIILGIGGAVFELLGIILVGAADLVPQARRGAVWVAAQYGRFVRWIRRLIGRPKPVTVSAKVGGSIALGGHVSAITGTSAYTLWGKVDYLLRESERTQRRLDDLERKLDFQRERLDDEVRRVNRELVAHVDQAIRAAASEYVTARRVGLVCLAFATILFVLATTVS